MTRLTFLAYSALPELTGERAQPLNVDEPYYYDSAILPLYYLFSGRVINRLSVTVLSAAHGGRSVYPERAHGQCRIIARTHKRTLKPHQIRTILVIY